MDQFAKLFSSVRGARRFAVDDSGATAIEYAMIASGIAVAIAAAITLLGGKVGTMFQTVAAIFS
jgi:pilus assembly protein Flp/PilA